MKSDTHIAPQMYAAKKNCFQFEIIMVCVFVSYDHDDDATSTWTLVCGRKDFLFISENLIYLTSWTWMFVYI